MKTDALDIHALAVIYRHAAPEYRPDTTTDDDAMLRIKGAMARVLSPDERMLFIIYAEVRSLSRMAAALNVSKSTVRNEIARIRQSLINAL